MGPLAGASGLTRLKPADWAGPPAAQASSVDSVVDIIGGPPSCSPWTYHRTFVRRIDASAGGRDRSREVGARLGRMQGRFPLTGHKDKRAVG